MCAARSIIISPAPSRRETSHATRNGVSQKEYRNSRCLGMLPGDDSTTSLPFRREGGTRRHNRSRVVPGLSCFNLCSYSWQMPFMASATVSKSLKVRVLLLAAHQMTGHNPARSIEETSTSAWPRPYGMKKISSASARTYRTLENKKERKLKKGSSRYLRGQVGGARAERRRDFLSQKRNPKVSTTPQRNKFELHG